MGLVPGERVKYLNEKGGGVVIKVLPDQQVEILDDEGLHLVFRQSELVGQRGQVVDEKEIASRWKGREKKESGKPGEVQSDLREYLMASRQKWNARNKDFIEVDLHIEEIVSLPGKLRDGEKLLLQLEHAARCLSQAREYRIPRIIFIHGVGEGILRNELLAMLKGMSDVSFHNADFRTYGMGATEVRLLGLYK